MAKPTKRAAPKPKQIKKKIAKNVKAKADPAKPRATRTIQETVADAKVDQPSAGNRKLPRVNRRNKAAAAKGAATKKKVTKKGGNKKK